jgi:pilus assembly protein CpaE
LIFDLSKRFTATDLTAMRMSDVVLLVCQLELTSLRNVVRMVHTFGQDEALAQKIRIIVNRVGADDGEITLQKAEETIGQPVYWQVPNDFKALTASRNAGEPLLTHAPKCKTQLSLVGLASALSGKDAQAPKKERRGFFSFR